MALFDLKKVTKSVSDAAKQVSDAANNFAKEAQEKLPESMQDINVAESMKDMAKKGSDALKRFSRESADTHRSVKEAMGELEDREIKTVSIDGALKVIYCIMAVDGKIHDDEVTEFCLIGPEIDPLFSEHKDDLVAEMTAKLSHARDDEEYLETIRDEIRDVFRDARRTKDNPINGKLLLWDLYAVSNSDGECSDKEMKLIKYAEKQMNADSTVVLEMEAALKTLLAIQEEENFLRTSDRPYSMVEPHMNELSDRKNAILQGVRALITD